MARLWNSGFELNSLTAQVEFSVITTPFTIVTTNPRSGTYHGRVTAGNGFLRSDQFTTNRSTIGYIGVAVLIHSAVNASTQLVRWSSAANASVGNITLTTSNTLVLLAANGTQIGSASVALTVDTWYYLELKNDATGAGALEARLNGSVFATGANSAAGNWARALIGCVTGTQTTNDIYFDDWKVNDSTGSSQTGYPGTGNLSIVRPTGAGDSNTFAVQVGGTIGSANNFTRVNEVPPDDATSYNATVVLNQEDFFTVGSSGVGSSDTVNVVTVGLRYADITAVDLNTSIRAEIKKVTGGTIAQSVDLDPDQTTWVTNNNSQQPSPYPLVMYSDPDGSAWSNTTLGTMQIGYKLTIIGTNPVGITNIWAYIDYTPGSPPVISGGSTLMMMGI